MTRFKEACQGPKIIIFLIEGTHFVHLAVHTKVKLIFQMLYHSVRNLSIRDVMRLLFLILMKGTPEQTKLIIDELSELLPTDKIAMHMHDTHGRAIENIQIALSYGISIDASVAGLGDVHMLLI